MSDPTNNAADSIETMKLLESLHIPFVFGLEAQGHIPTVERMLAEDATWDEIGKAIGWHGPAVADFFARYALRTIAQLREELAAANKRTPEGFCPPCGDLWDATLTAITNRAVEIQDKYDFTDEIGAKGVSVMAALRVIDVNVARLQHELATTNERAEKDRLDLHTAPGSVSDLKRLGERQIDERDRCVDGCTRCQWTGEFQVADVCPECGAAGSLLRCRDYELDTDIQSAAYRYDAFCEGAELAEREHDHAPKGPIR